MPYYITSAFYKFSYKIKKLPANYDLAVNYRYW